MSKSASTPEGETVWTATATNRSETAGEDKVYHTNRSCYKLQHAGSSASHPRSAMNNGWRVCEACAGTQQPTGEARTMDCPFCGEPMKNLPAHMRGCDG